MMEIPHKEDMRVAGWQGVLGTEFRPSERVVCPLFCSAIHVAQQCDILLCIFPLTKKTVIKQALKYAPLRADFQRVLSTDGTVKKEIAKDMTEIDGEDIWDVQFREETA